MEEEKVKEKAKRGDNKSSFSASVTMRLIVLAFLLLTLTRMYFGMDALPIFSWNYEAAGMLLLVLPIFVFLAKFWRNSLLIPLVLLSIGLLIFCGPILAIGFYAGRGLADWVYLPLTNLSGFVFLLLFIGSLFLYPMSEKIAEKLSLAGLQLIAVGLIWLAAFYIWGYGGWLDGRRYDEGLNFEHGYHILIHPGFQGNLGTFELYECQDRRMFCTLVYESEAGLDDADKTDMTWAQGKLYIRYEDVLILEHPFS